MTLTEILAAFSVGRTEFGNLYRAGHFSTVFAGDEYRFSPTRDNALDIAFLTRLR